METAKGWSGKKSFPTKLLEADLQSLTGLCLDRVRTREESAYWNGLIDEYHYLGYKPLPGAGKVFDSLGRGRLRSHRLFRIGMESGRSRPVDRLGCVDSQKGLRLIVNNARFLVLPNIRVKNLASRVLSLCARRVRVDFFRDL